MKKSILVMIIVVFMAALVAPVIAEKEGGDVHADITIARCYNPGHVLRRTRDQEQGRGQDY